MRVLQLGVGEVAHHARQEPRPEADEERGHRDDDDRPHPAGVDLTARQCGQQGARKLHDRDERDDAADRADHAQGDDASKAAGTGAKNDSCVVAPPFRSTSIATPSHRRKRPLVE